MANTNGTIQPPRADNFRGTVLRHFVAIVLVTELLVFLAIALLIPFDPGFINLSPQSEGIIVGGVMVTVQSIILSLFQTEATKQAAQSSQTAHDAGVAAAMAPPPSQTTTVSTGPPVSVTTGPTPSNESRPCLDCGLSADEHADISGHIYRPV